MVALKGSLSGLLSTLLIVLPIVSAQVPRRSPSLADPFSVELPVPSIKSPLTSYTDPATGKQIDYYEIRISPFTKKYFPALPGSARLVGYDGTEPGPTFLIPKGRETVVRVISENSEAGGGNGRNSAVHLHGSASRTPFDGWAQDVIAPGQYKDYYYPNQQSARTLWYHVRPPCILH